MVWKSQRKRVSALNELPVYQGDKVLVAQSCPTLFDPLDCKEIQPVHSEGDQPWDFLGRNDAKAETPELWLPHAKC